MFGMKRTLLLALPLTSALPTPTPTPTQNPMSFDTWYTTNDLQSRLHTLFDAEQSGSVAFTQDLGSFFDAEIDTVNAHRRGGEKAQHQESYVDPRTGVRGERRGSVERYGEERVERTTAKVTGGDRGSVTYGAEGSERVRKETHAAGRERNVAAGQRA